MKASVFFGFSITSRSYRSLTESHETKPTEFYPVDPLATLAFYSAAFSSSQERAVTTSVCVRGDRREGNDATCVRIPLVPVGNDQRKRVFPSVCSHNGHHDSWFSDAGQSWYAPAVANRVHRTISTEFDFRRGKRTLFNRNVDGRKACGMFAACLTWSSETGGSTTLAIIAHENAQDNRRADATLPTFLRTGKRTKKGDNDEDGFARM